MALIKAPTPIQIANELQKKMFLIRRKCAAAHIISAHPVSSNFTASMQDDASFV